MVLNLNSPEWRRMCVCVCVCVCLIALVCMCVYKGGQRKSERDTVQLGKQFPIGA